MRVIFFFLTIVFIFTSSNNYPFIPLDSSKIQADLKVNNEKKKLGLNELQLENHIPIELITIIKVNETATFNMGTSAEEIEKQPTMDDPDYNISDEQPVHKVKLTTAYAMSKFEITNKLFCRVMNWSIIKGYTIISEGDLKSKDGIKYLGITNLIDDKLLGVQYGIVIDNNEIKPIREYANHPVHAVTWYGAVAFCNFLSEMEKLQPVYNLTKWTWDEIKNGYRLPTEAEWEYAARKDKRYTFAWGNKIDSTYLNYWQSKNYRPFKTVTMPVGFYNGELKYNIKTQNNASPFGLYDMTGNVWEWCWDWYSKNYYSISPMINPKGPELGDDRPPYHINEQTKVWRGCGWAGNNAFSRIAKRWSSTPDLSINEVGFRIVRSIIK